MKGEKQMVKSVKNVSKKIIACVMAAAIAFTAVPGTAVFAAGSPVASVTAVDSSNNVVTFNKQTATVNTKSDGTAVITKVASTNASKVKVASAVTVNGITYKVTKLAANVLSNAKKASKVVVPSSITTIAKNAFKGCSSLKKISLKTTKAITVKKGAFAGLNTKKMTVVVNKKISSTELAKLKANLKAAGFKGTVKRAA
jgi:hypothetical protein